MRLLSLQDSAGRNFVGLRTRDGRGVVDVNRALPSLLAHDVGTLVRSGEYARVQKDIEKAESAGELVTGFAHRPLTAAGGKVLCLGLNFVDHAKESKNDTPTWPVVFGRFDTSFVGHDQAILRPRVSTHFDFEAEVVVVIGKAGRYVDKARALEHVLGYTLMNDGSIRDYQVKTPQWMIGKNFDRSGSLGPELVTADELPEGARGLVLEGRLNGEVMQRASTSDMVFDVETTIALLSEATTLEPGDLIAMGTPSGVGFARKPPVYMKPGDVFEVVLERLGTLKNHVADEG